jgi:single-strand DNA-binding protein
MSSSAPAVNTVTLVGNLTADPVLNKVDENRTVCDMRIAVNLQKDKPPMFIDVAAFGNQAETCARYLTKGRAIAVTDRLIYREWLADDGTRRSKHCVQGRIQFGGKPDELAGRHPRRQQGGHRLLSSDRRRRPGAAGLSPARSIHTHPSNSAQKDHDMATLAISKVPTPQFQISLTRDPPPNRLDGRSGRHPPGRERVSQPKGLRTVGRTLRGRPVRNEQEHGLPRGWTHSLPARYPAARAVHATSRDAAAIACRRQIRWPRGLG